MLKLFWKIKRKVLTVAKNVKLKNTFFIKPCSLILLLLLIFSLTACDKDGIVMNELKFKEYDNAFDVKDLKFNKDRKLIEFVDNGIITDEENPKALTYGGEKKMIGQARHTFKNLQYVKSKADKVEGALQYFGYVYAVIELDGERYAVKLDNYEKSFTKIKLDDFLRQVYNYQSQYGDTLSGGNGLSS